MITIDLNGPDGNAFFLLGRVRNWGAQLGYTKEKIDGISNAMKAGDYNNLLRVFVDEFGTIAELESSIVLDGINEELYTVNEYV